MRFSLFLQTEKGLFTDLLERKNNFICVNSSWIIKYIDNPCRSELRRKLQSFGDVFLNWSLHRNAGIFVKLLSSPVDLFLIKYAFN